MMLAIVVLALVGGSGVGRAQNNERIDKANNTPPTESAQIGSSLTPANNLEDEIKASSHVL